MDSEVFGPEQVSPPSQPLSVVADGLGKRFIDQKELILAIGHQIRDHARGIPKPREAQSILESRLTPAQQAYDEGMTSYGSVASISAEMLRHLGREVRLVHGEIPQSVDHAWIDVCDPDTKEWVQYDLTRPDGHITPEHK
jgi:hypothetical protein